jgi:hypothetical protein
MRLSWLFLVAFSLLLSGCKKTEDDNEIPHRVWRMPAHGLSLSVNAKHRPEAGFVLEIKVTNDLRDSLSFYEYDLPWRADDILELTARVKGQTLKRGPRPIDDPTLAQVTLEPGKSINGTIFLTARYPELDECLKTQDVELIWSYRVMSGGTIYGDDGSLVIPKIGQGEPVHSAAVLVPGNASAIND